MGQRACREHRRVKNKRISVVVAAKSEILGIIVEFHGFAGPCAPPRRTCIRLSRPKPGATVRTHRLKAISMPMTSPLFGPFGTCRTTPSSSARATSTWNRSAMRAGCGSNRGSFTAPPPRWSFPPWFALQDAARMDIAERASPRWPVQDELSRRRDRVAGGHHPHGVWRESRCSSLTPRSCGTSKPGVFPESWVRSRNARANSGLILWWDRKRKTTTLYRRTTFLAASEHFDTGRSDRNGARRAQPDRHAAEDRPDLRIGAEKRLAAGPRCGDGWRDPRRRDRPECGAGSADGALGGLTVHTIDVASAIGRLLDLGVLPFLLSSVLTGWWRSAWCANLPAPRGGRCAAR